MSSSQDFKYAGGELDLLSRCVNWKSYYKSWIAPYLGKRVLEVGAGTGTTTRVLCDGSQERWVCLEPDPEMASAIRADIRAAALPACCEVQSAFTGQLQESRTFDSVLYIDVLEHIKHDAEEANEATRLLKPGGRFIVMAPAHQALYSPFDKAIGHYRRYDKKSLKNLVPLDMRCEKLIYLDSLGLLVLLLNSWLLRRKMPTKRQLSVWDQRLIPLSRCMDPLLSYRLGKSILGVWQMRL